MAKNKLILKKQRSLTAKKLTEARARARQLRADEDALAQQLEAVQDEIPADLEQQLQTITDAQTETDDLIGELVDTLQGLDDALAQLEDAPPAEDPPMDDPAAARSAARPASRRSVPSGAVPAASQAVPHGTRFTAIPPSRISCNVFVPSPAPAAGPSPARS